MIRISVGISATLIVPWLHLNYRLLSPRKKRCTFHNLPLLASHHHIDQFCVSAQQHQQQLPNQTKIENITIDLWNRIHWYPHWRRKRDRERTQRIFFVRILRTVTPTAWVCHTNRWEGFSLRIARIFTYHWSNIMLFTRAKHTHTHTDSWTWFWLRFSFTLSPRQIPFSLS